MKKLICLTLMLFSFNAKACVLLDNFKLPLDMITDLGTDSGFMYLTRFYNGTELAYTFNNENFDNYSGIRIVGPESIVVLNGPSGVSYGYTRNGYLPFKNMQYSKLFNNINMIRLLPVKIGSFKSVSLVDVNTSLPCQ